MGHFFDLLVSGVELTVQPGDVLCRILGTDIWYMRAIGMLGFVPIMARVLSMTGILGSNNVFSYVISSSMWGISVHRPDEGSSFFTIFGYAYIILNILFAFAITSMGGFFAGTYASFNKVQCFLALFLGIAIGIALSALDLSLVAAAGVLVATGIIVASQIRSVDFFGDAPDAVVGIVLVVIMASAYEVAFGANFGDSQMLRWMGIIISNISVWIFPISFIAGFIAGIIEEY